MKSMQSLGDLSTTESAPRQSNACQQAAGAHLNELIPYTLPPILLFVHEVQREAGQL